MHGGIQPQYLAAVYSALNLYKSRSFASVQVFRDFSIPAFDVAARAVSHIVGGTSDAAIGDVGGRNHGALFRFHASRDFNATPHAVVARDLENEQMSRGSQYRCGRVGMGIQPPPNSPTPIPTHTQNPNWSITNADGSIIL